MKAVNKYIIVEQIKEELKTNSGLLLTGDDKDNVRYNKTWYRGNSYKRRRYNLL